MPNVRPRFAGAHENLFKELQVIVSKNGKTAIKYDETEKVQQARVDRKLIVSQKEIIQACHRCDATLKFKRTTVQACMLALYDEFSTSWTSPPSRTVWAETMSRRLRNLLHVVMTSLNRKKPPDWIAELELDNLAALHGALQQGAPTPPEPSVVGEEEAIFIEYFYGWDPQLKLAFRQKHEGVVDKDAELSCPPYARRRRW